MNDYWKVITDPYLSIIKFKGEFYRLNQIGNPKMRLAEQKWLLKESKDGVTVVYQAMQDSNLLVLKYPTWPFESVEIYDVWGMAENEYQRLTIDDIDLLTEPEYKYVTALYGEVR